MGYYTTTVVADTTFTLKDQMTMGETTTRYTSDGAYVWAEVSVIYKGDNNGYRTRSVAVVSGASYSTRVNNMGGNDYILELIETKYIPQPPSAPTFITIPSIVKGGENISISWGSGLRASSYYLERQVNGGSWSTIYSGANPSYVDAITKGWNTVAYRVRAYNSDGYSGYSTSSTIKVINFPEFNMKVDGVLKTSENGWVKIDGQLREIDSIYTKIDEILKEV